MDENKDNVYQTNFYSMQKPLNDSSSAIFGPNGPKTCSNTRPYGSLNKNKTFENG
jgi:hypothetical protein